VTNDFLDRDHQVVSSDIPLESEGGVPVDTVLLDSHDMVLAQSPKQPFGDPMLRDLAAAARGDGAYWTNVTDDSGIPRSVHATRLDDAGNVLLVSRSLTEDRDALTTTELLFGALSVLMIAIGGALSYWLAGQALRPVHTIAGLARTISEHDLHQRVDIRPPEDELGELVTTFNAMLARLESSFDGLRTFTADAAHELRAPIAVMRLELERGLGRARSANEYREVLQWLEDDVDRLGRMVDQLLVLTRADAGLLRPVLRQVDLADLLSEAAARWARAAKARGVTIGLDLSASGSIRADPALLQRVVDNLLDNAIRHAPSGSEVRLRATRTATGMEVDVLDQGPGVNPELRPRLFSRFGRADGARMSGDGAGAGAGLGLALGAAIARAHGGWLELVEQDGPGALFRLHLPDVAPSR
ncbi:MAG TPA: ATP-binding protein, partial [Candidatus Dormibacteraeota bacterium]|nr:ATP-binding protein [Candidatus Dormibacteraeota bacterium]